MLVVDDDPSVGEMHCDMLESFDCDKLMRDNGKDALRLAAEKKPDLILLDMVMPSMNGLTVLRSLKSDSATKKIPVVMLSGEQKGSDVEAAFALGAVDYIIKPAVRQEFENKVKAILTPLGYTFPS